MFTRIHHIGLVVSDLEKAKRLWVDTYGFKVDEPRSPLPHGRYVDLDGVNILDIPVGEAELEINMPTNAESGTARYLARHGHGPHHLCLYSDDIEDDVRRLQDGGLQLVVPTTGIPDEKGGPRVAFFTQEAISGSYWSCGRTCLPTAKRHGATVVLLPTFTTWASLHPPWSWGVTSPVTFMASKSMRRGHLFRQAVIPQAITSGHRISPSGSRRSR